MNIKEFLNDPIFSIPIPAHKYFPDHLSIVFTRYLELIRSIDDNNREFVLKFESEIVKSCEQIQLINQYYFEGKILSAYQKFAELISHYEQYLVQRDKDAVIGDIDSHLFKARPKLEKDYNIQDMFHVPFEKRYTIKSSRFSLTGLPCLYLSNTIYTCWEELDRPLFSQMAVSRFKSQKNSKYLDLSVNLWFLQVGFRDEIFYSKQEEETSAILLQATFMQLEKFLQLFPLYVACYTKVFDKDSDFKPEYIFPQMLMEWIVNTNWIDGIIYESTKTARLKISGGIPNLKDSLNYAIPVRSSAENGFCNIITKNLKLTKPTSWEMVGILKPEVITKDVDVRNDILGKFSSPPIMTFNLPNEDNLSYFKTVFGRFEYYLYNQPLFSIDREVGTVSNPRRTYEV